MMCLKWLIMGIQSERHQWHFIRVRKVQIKIKFYIFFISGHIVHKIKIKIIINKNKIIH